jgi:YfiR/HmsC-like
MTRRRGAGALTVALTLGLAVFARPGPARAGELAEAAAKAAFLYNLAPFVDWPPATFAAPADPFVICIVGKDPLGPALDQAIAGQKAAGRPIVVRRLAKVAREAGCQIVYLGGADGPLVKDTLAAVHGSPVLTVTDNPGPPGIIDLAFGGGQLHFRVDDQMAAEGGLTLSSKLLSLAISVRARPAPAKPVLAKP